jgi:hypothetical protein
MSLRLLRLAATWRTVMPFCGAKVRVGAQKGRVSDKETKRRGRDKSGRGSRSCV